jgi:Zn-dependent peptidase ImmA (M78 family)
MKWLPNGRIWFEPDEIERTMEQELRKANLLPPLETPAVDLERLIQRHLGVALDQYAALEQGVLGKTEFYSDAKPKVFINRILTEAVDEEDCPAGVRGRWRATMAHEAAHLILHRILYDPQLIQLTMNSMSLPSDKTQLLRCGQGDISFRKATDWREIQANLGMAALLMPQSRFTACVQASMKAFGVSSMEMGSPNAIALIGQMARRFQVSRQAATIRFETLRLLSPAGQQTIAGI